MPFGTQTLSIVWSNTKVILVVKSLLLVFWKPANHLNMSEGSISLSSKSKQHYAFSKPNKVTNNVSKIFPNALNRHGWSWLPEYLAVYRCLITSFVCISMTFVNPRPRLGCVAWPLCCKLDIFYCVKGHATRPERSYLLLWFVEGRNNYCIEIWTAYVMRAVLSEWVDVDQRFPGKGTPMRGKATSGTFTHVYKIATWVVGKWMNVYEPFDTHNWQRVVIWRRSSNGAVTIKWSGIGSE